MRHQQAYDAWNKRRREVWPCATHSAYSSEQVLIDMSKGHQLVADWDLNYIRDPLPKGVESVA